MDRRKSWLLPILAFVRKAPPMVISDERVESLDAFIRAYGLARMDLGVARMSAEDAELVAAFNSWLGRRMNWAQNDKWPAYVRHADSGPKNVYTFFALLEEFLATTGRSLDDVKPWKFAK